MNHPKPEEWAPYLFGEAGPVAGRRLKAHLATCPECRAHISGWKRSVERLDAWELPRTEPSRALFAPALRWAVAALLVVGIGFGLGRLTAAPRVSSGELHALVAGEVRGELARAQRQTTNALAALETRRIQAADLQSRSLLQGFTEVLAQARAQDRQAVLALFRELEEQHTTAYVALRKDLETLASLTDDQLRQARFRLMEFAANGTQSPTPNH